VGVKVFLFVNFGEKSVSVCVFEKCVLEGREELM